MAKDMRVPPDHLGVQLRADLLLGEGILLFIEAHDKGQREEQITAFFPNRGRIARINGSDQFLAFIQQVSAHASGRLPLVPGAAALAPEPVNQRHQGAEAFRIPLHAHHPTQEAGVLL